ncbi:DUF4179 domain-containing protein [Clostridium sp. KNHs214]|uniref:DUF4179 domain-containing protein n=1 Tax=Clostridium sp. KNHs214 TaxID=1540257 RepID=UPI00055170C1|nr:DUF4179 domain-containing protein [Clostridium sp. KNHs214]
MNMEEKILDIIDFVDVKEEDFNNINVDISEIEKERIKKNLRKKIRSKKRNKSKTIAVAGILAAVLLSGTILYKPAFAERNPIFDAIYDGLGYYKDYKDYTQYIGESKSSNGYNFTIEKLVGTPNKIIIAVKIHSEKPFGKIEDVKSMFMPSFKMNDIMMWDGASSGCTLIDKNNLMMVIEEDSIKGFPKRGNIKMSIHSTVDDKTNVDFSFKTDFSSSYKKTVTKKLKGTVKEGNIKVERINSSILGSVLMVDNYHIDKGDLLLKLDDNIYTSNERGAKDGKGHIFFPAATYEKVKSANKISVILVKNNMKFSDKEHEDINKKIQKSLENESLDKNIKYNKYLTFTDGTKGEFYNIERSNNKVKLYFRSDKYAKEFATHVRLHEYFGDTSTDNYDVKQYFSCAYKDSNDDKGYVIEFDNVNTDKQLEVSFYLEELIPEKNKIGEEIRVR